MKVPITRLEGGVKTSIYIETDKIVGIEKFNEAKGFSYFKIYFDYYIWYADNKDYDTLLKAWKDGVYVNKE